MAIPQMVKGEIDVSTAKVISEADFIEWTRRTKPTRHDVVLSRRCNPGETAVVRDQEFALGQNLVLLRSEDDKLHPPFLRWLCRGREWWDEVERYRNPGSVFDSLKCRDVPNFTLPIPPHHEQVKIANLLGALDDKIQLNRRMARTLEEFARALFRSWFIDFEPVREKMEGRKPSLACDIADLFPDRLDDDGVPENWRTAKLGEVAENVVDRCAPGEATRARPYVPIDCITARTTILREFRSGEEAASSLIQFQAGDILFGAMRPYFHKVALAPWAGTSRTTVFVLRARAEADRHFVLFLLDQPSTIKFATSHSTGSTIPYAVWNGSMSEMPIVLPPAPLRERFEREASIMHGRALAAEAQTALLTNLRDSLLPKLVSGELRIDDAAALTEIAA